MISPGQAPPHSDQSPQNEHGHTLPVDGLSGDHKIETQRADNDVADTELEKIHLSSYLTSIYDHSIYEAFYFYIFRFLKIFLKSLQIINAGEGVEKREPSYTVGGDVNGCSHYGEQYGGSLKN